MRRLAALYVILWTLEGAIRKWVPGSETIFYVARDGIILIAILLAALSTARAVRSTALLWVAGIAVSLWTAIQVIGFSLPLPVAVIGLRSYIAPLLFLGLIWAYGELDVVETIKRTICVFIPIQAVVAALQTASPPASWINKEVASDSASFVLDGVVRASGTFSSPSGLMFFIALGAASSVTLATRRGWLQGVLFALVLVTTGISGARGSVLALGVVLAVYAYKLLADGGFQAVKRVVVVATLIGAAALVLFLVFPGIVQTFLLRFETASASEDSTQRLIYQTVGFLAYPLSVIGSGAGAQSQAGIGAGSAVAWIEVDSIRWVAELGILGLALAIIRLVIAGGLSLLVIFRARYIDLTTATFIAALVPVLLYGAVSQTPSSQGFAAICGGVIAISLQARHRMRAEGGSSVHANLAKPQAVVGW